MTPEEQFKDTEQQIAYMNYTAHEYNYSDISELFHDEPELFERIATQFRQNETL